jgi:hypothetical protein
VVGPLHVIVGTAFVTRKNAFDDSTPQSPSVGAGVGDVGATEAVGAADAVGAAELGVTVGAAVGAAVVGPAVVGAVGAGVGVSVVCE